MSDLIDRQAAIDKFIDGLEEIFADIRERHVDDSVCGLCEYDGAYIGQSGDWCNECPGFDKDDCFKLSDKIRKKWADEIIKAMPSAQPDCSDCIKHGGDWDCDHVHCHKGKSAQPDNDMIHLQKEQAYLQGWEDGRKALKEEMSE